MRSTTTLTTTRRGSRRAAVVLVCAVLGAQGCVDPAATAKRGEEELQRHRDDPILVSPIPGLQLTSTSDSAARAVEQDPIFPSWSPTTLSRSFEMAGYTPDQLFAAYQTHLDRSNLTLTGITCQVTMRRESRMWSGVSRGDDVSATVDVSPAQRRVSFTLSIRGRATGPRPSEERSLEANSVGLRNCLTVALPATAYSSGYAALRSREELCRLVTGALPEAVSTTSADPGAQICTLTLPDGASGTIELFAEDLRTASLAQLLDGAPPRTEPYAPFFLDTNTGSCKVTMLTLPDGALRFSADDAAICTTFAQAAINQR